MYKCTGNSDAKDFKYFMIISSLRVSLPLSPMCLLIYFMIYCQYIEIYCIMIAACIYLFIQIVRNVHTVSNY